MVEAEVDEDTVDEEERRILLMVTLMKSTTSSNSFGGGSSMVSETHQEKWHSYKAVSYQTAHIVSLEHITLAIRQQKWHFFLLRNSI